MSTMPVSIKQIAESLCATPAKTFSFCKMLFIFFVTKTLKSCWLKICTSQNVATFKVLVPAPTGKQWVSPWKAATAQHFGSFSSFFKFGHKRPFPPFSSARRCGFQKYLNIFATLVTHFQQTFTFLVAKCFINNYWIPVNISTKS